MRLCFIALCGIVSISLNLLLYTLSASEAIFSHSLFPSLSFSLPFSLFLSFSFFLYLFLLHFFFISVALSLHIFRFLSIPPSFRFSSSLTYSALSSSPISKTFFLIIQTDCIFSVAQLSHFHNAHKTMKKLR